MTSVPVLLDRLVADIQLIVYRYIHKSRFEEVNQEYRINFQTHWSDYDHHFVEKCVGTHEVMCLNYRELQHWYSGHHSYGPIYNFRERQRDYLLPKNYAHAVVWWPAKIWDTHIPILNNQVL